MKKKFQNELCTRMFISLFAKYKVRRKAGSKLEKEEVKNLPKNPGVNILGSFWRFLLLCSPQRSLPRCLPHRMKPHFRPLPFIFARSFQFSSLTNLHGLSLRTLPVPNLRLRSPHPRVVPSRPLHGFLNGKSFKAA